MLRPLESNTEISKKDSGKEESSEVTLMVWVGGRQAVDVDVRANSAVVRRRRGWATMVKVNQEPVLSFLCLINVVSESRSSRD
eukprot:scaffold59779_cov34-Cyclotella_meneghiniana.AAC.1